jgi:hypothetical protein
VDRPRSELSVPAPGVSPRIERPQGGAGRPVGSRTWEFVVMPQTASTLRSALTFVCSILRRRRSAHHGAAAAGSYQRRARS